MTKPSQFIANSDYLSLAQKSTTEFTVVFPQETLPEGQTSIRTHDITVSSVTGAVDEIMISRNNSDYYLGNLLVVNANSPSLSFYVYRSSPDTLQVRLCSYNSTAGGYAMPTQTIKVRVSSYLPPNVF